MSGSSLAAFFGSLPDLEPGSHGFAEEPVPLDVFVRDKRYLANPALSTEQYEAVRHAEKVYLPETYKLLAGSDDPAVRAYWGQPCRMCNLITLEWGKGAGKDHICRVISLRVAYLLLCLPSPQDYYKMPGQDTIHLLNVASSAPQASRAFFAPLRRAVARPGGWFSGVSEAVEAGPAQRRDPAKPLMNMVRFDKNVEAISGHSNADGQEGLNLLVGIMDEVDAFKSRAELAKLQGNRLRESSSSAESVLDMLQTSASTRFPATYKSIRISYPRYLGSTIQQLRARGQKDIEEKGEASRHYVSGPKATWEVNPRVTGKDVFREDYDEDPVMAAAKYECKPSRAVNPYFANMLAVEACLAEHPDPPLQVAYVRDMAAWKPAYSFAERLYPVRGAAYAIHADMAVSRDRAGIALAHVARWQDATVTGHDEKLREVSVTEPRPVVKLDFAITFEADIAASPPREIQVRWFRDLVLELIRRGFSIRRATMDGFQSVDSLQILEAHGIDTARVSTDLSEDLWRTLRDLAYEDRLRGYKDRLLLAELAGLSKLPNGKIDHPADGCFSGDTRIPLLDGREVQISALADGNPVWVYASDVQGNVVPALAVGRRTKQVRQVCDVVLDTGAAMRCTPEHLWRLQDGTYKEAQYLTADDRLLPLNRMRDFSSGYEKVWSWGSREQTARWTHVMVREHFDGRPLLKSEVSHHDNEVKRDNRPENLIRMDTLEHKAHHARKRHAEDESYVSSLRRAQRAYWSTQEAKDAQREVFARGDAMRGRQRKVRLLHAERLELLRSVRDAKSVGAAARRVGLARNSAIAVLKSNGFESWEDFRARDGENHRVRFVELVELEEPIWVYDLEVDTYHNFALASGVFVHNSKDLADAVACACAGAVLLGGSEDPSGARAYLSGGWVQARAAGLPAGMPPGAVAGALSFDADLPDFAVTAPGQAGGPGWLFADTGESYGGQVLLLSCPGAGARLSFRDHTRIRAGLC